MARNTTLDRPLKGYNYYLIMWHSYGLEAIIDLGEIYRAHEDADAQKMWNILANKPQPQTQSLRTNLGQLISNCMLRARANAERGYEIYSIRTKSSIKKSDLTELFTDNPQSAADLIRARGQKLFGLNKARQVIV